MGKTAAEFVAIFRLEGTDKIWRTEKQIKALDLSMKKMGNTTSILAQAAKSTGFAMGEMAKVVGSRMVRATDILDKKNGKSIGTMREWIKVVKESNGVMIQHKYATEQLGRKNSALVPGSASSRQLIGKEADAFGVQKSFLQRLNPLAGQDIDVAGLISRAAITIPVWMAMRAAMQGVFSIIPAGIKRFRELDTAIANMKILTSDVGAFDNFSGVAKEKLDTLSKSIGLPIEKLSELYIAFSETGIDPETAFAGMEIAAKGAISTMADATSMARVLAGALNNMGDTVEVGTTKSEKLEYMMALTTVVFKENAGRVDDYVAALKNSVNAASNAGVPFRSLLATVGTLATAMREGAKGGNAIRIAFKQLSSESGAISELLDRQISNEELENTDVLMGQVLRKFKEIRQGGQSNTKLVESIFGAKSRVAIDALLNNIEKYESNNGLQLLVDDMDKVRKINLTDFLEQMDTLNRQLDRTKQIAPSLAKSFTAGLVGIEGKEATQKLTELNDKLQESGDEFVKYGEILRTMLQGGAFALFAIWLHGIGNALIFAPFGVKLLSAATAALGVKLLAMVPAMLTFIAFLAAINAYKSVKRDFKDLEEVTTNLVESKLAEAAAAGGNFDNAMGKLIEDKWIKRPGEKDKGWFRDGAEEVFRDKQLLRIPKEQWQSLRRQFNENLGKGIDSQTPFAVNGGGPQDLNDIQFPRNKQAEFLVTAEKLKGYGVDDIQILKQRIKLNHDWEEQYTMLLELAKKIRKETADMSENFRKSLETSIKDNLEGKGNDMFQDLSDNITNQLRSNVAENLSKIVISTGITDAFTTIFAEFNNITRTITDPIVEAHSEGGETVYKWIVKAFTDIKDQQSSDSNPNTDGTNLDAKSSTVNATFGTGVSQGGLGGFWGNKRFDKPIFKGRSPAGENGQPTDLTGSQPKGLTYGQLGYGATMVSGAALTASSGISQIRGGGAKNITQGVATVAGAIGGVAVAGVTAGLITGGAANFWNPVGWVLLVIAAVLTIASLFMKGAKQQSSQSQTTESKIASKIDISNKSLEIVNRNLVDLKTAITTFVLPNSAYFSEKRNVEDLWSLSARRGVYT